MTPTYDGRAVVLGDTLVVADCHVGRGTGGELEFPVGSGTDMVERFRDLVGRHAPEEVVIAGDLLHSFETVPRQVETTLAGLRKGVRDIGAEMVVTPGNHDTMLDAAYAGDLHDEYAFETDNGETVVVTHGHEEPERAADAYVVGHDHPAIEI